MYKLVDIVGEINLDLLNPACKVMLNMRTSGIGIDKWSDIWNESIILNCGYEIKLSHDPRKI